jgi:hypothetical protein
MTKMELALIGNLIMLAPHASAMGASVIGCVLLAVGWFLTVTEPA